MKGILEKLHVAEADFINTAIQIHQPGAAVRPGKPHSDKSIVIIDFLQDWQQLFPFHSPYLAQDYRKPLQCLKVSLYLLNDGGFFLFRSIIQRLDILTLVLSDHLHQKQQAAGNKTCAQ